MTQESKAVEEVTVTAKKGEFDTNHFFGKRLSFERSDAKIIKELRKWSATSFAKYNMLTTKYITSLHEVPQKGGQQESGKYFDFDLQCKVLQLFKTDEYCSEVRLLDNSDQIWHCSVLNLKYRWLRQGQYVRIRAATLQNHAKGYERFFGLKSYSNILCLPYPCKLAQDMFFDEHNSVR